MPIRIERLDHTFSDKSSVEHMEYFADRVTLVGEPARLSRELREAVEPINLGRAKDRFLLGIDAFIKLARNSVESNLFAWADALCERGAIEPPEKVNDQFYLKLVKLLEGQSVDDVVSKFKIKKFELGRPNPVHKFTRVEVPSILPGDSAMHGRVGDVFPYKVAPAYRDHLRLNTKLQTEIGRTLGILEPKETWRDFLTRSTFAQEFLPYSRNDYRPRDEHGVLGLWRGYDFQGTPDLFIVNKLNFQDFEAIVGFSVPAGREQDFTTAEAFDANATSPMIRLVIPTRSFFSSPENSAPASIAA